MTAMLFSADVKSRLRLLAESYERLSGRPFAPPSADLATWLWNHPTAIVAHGTQADPVFFFGNRTTLGLFELEFEAFTQPPSRLSAGSMLRDEREQVLARVTAHDIIEDYSGVSVSSTGRRFRIERATVWNLLDEAGERHGQAALFAHWTPIN
jgi:hypothetical protein